MNKLEKLVFAFRKAIERAQKNDEPGEFFRKFPTGQCGHTSDLLAQFLIDNGGSQVRYVYGTYYGRNDKMQSHAWLSVGDMIIDITADQFRYHEAPLTNDIPVYIGPMNEYYKLFDMTFGDNHEHMGLERQWTNYRELIRCYDTIIRYI